MGVFLDRPIDGALQSTRNQPEAQIHTSLAFLPADDVLAIVIPCEATPSTCYGQFTNYLRPLCAARDFCGSGNERERICRFYIDKYSVAI